MKVIQIRPHDKEGWEEAAGRDVHEAIERWAARLVPEVVDVYVGGRQREYTLEVIVYAHDQSPVADD